MNAPRCFHCGFDLGHINDPCPNCLPNFGAPRHTIGPDKKIREMAAAIERLTRERDEARLWHEKAHTFLDQKRDVEAALAKAQQERDEARELAQLFSQADRKPDWIARAEALSTELANLRSRLVEAERERDKWVETAKNLSQTGFSLRRFVEVYGPKLGKINTTTVIRDESKRANAAEAELAKARATLAWIADAAKADGNADIEREARAHSRTGTDGWGVNSPSKRERI